MSYVEKALEIATKAHEGQYDKSGVPYIEHPKHVAEGVHGDISKATAYLHDVIEDTDVTADDLRRVGIPEEVVEAVVVLTHGEHENYYDYIRRVKKNPIAKEVKIADLKHNSDRSRIKTMMPNDVVRLAKYKKALRIINE